jgi:hypothetical protein
VCRKIQENFSNLNQFIASMKKCLLNSKSKEVLYKEVTGLRLPPVPVITRWNTWLETALFYRENFNQIKEFIESIKSDSKNESTKQIKRLVKEDKFIQELLEIKDYGFLMDSITKLQNPRLRLSEQKKVLDDSLDNLSGFAKQKFEKCLQKK